MKSSASESKPFESRSKGEIPDRDFFPQWFLACTKMFERLTFAELCQPRKCQRCERLRAKNRGEKNG